MRTTQALFYKVYVFAQRLVVRHRTIFSHQCHDRESKQRATHMQKQLKQLVVSDPKVMMGKPVIAGTRITVELILETLAFAAEALRYDVIYPIFETAS